LAYTRAWRGRVVVAALMLVGGAALVAQPPAEAEIAKRLRDKPIDSKTWKDWKGDLAAWAADYEKAKPAFEAAYKFAKDEATNDKGGWKQKSVLIKDGVGYLTLGVGELLGLDPTLKLQYERSEKARFYFDLALKQADYKDADAKQAAALYLHGLAIVRKETAPVTEGGKGKPDGRAIGQALDFFIKARALDPKLKTMSPKEEIKLALSANDNKRAEEMLVKAREGSPNDVELAQQLAQLYNQTKRKPEDFKPLVDKFPKDGVLVARMAYAAYHARDVKSAADLFKKAASLGANPATLFDAEWAKIDADLKKDADKTAQDAKATEAKELDAALRNSIRNGFSNVPPEKVPSAAELKKLLETEPFEYKTWVKWRKRLNDWSVKDFDKTKPAFEAAAAFLAPEGRKEIKKAALDNDHVAYLALALLAYDKATRDQAKAREAEVVVHLADRAIDDRMRDSARLGPEQLARAQLTKGLAIRMKELASTAEGGKGHADGGQLGEAFKQFDEARKNYPGLPGIPSLRDMAVNAHNGKLPRLAEERGKLAFDAKPDDAKLAVEYVRLVSYNDKDRAWLPKQHEAIKPAVDRHPNDPEILSWYGYTLQLDSKFKEAVAAWDKVEAQGKKPTDYNIAQSVVDNTRKNAEGFDGFLSGPVRFFKWLGWWAMLFTIFYGSVMILMCIGGLVLASKTKGPRAADMLGAPPDKLVSKGQTLRTKHETWLTRFYMIALTLALVLFYVSVPFMVIGLLIVFLLLLVIGLFMRRDRQSADMHSAMLSASGGGIWAVIKGVFTGFSQRTYGLLKDEDDCPKLYAVLREVAQRVDTEPVDEVYLNPGNDFGVKQLGRGPFGLLGRKKRVLVLGLCNMHFLTVTELKAILAHEYAHFSHSDTFYSRFIYQVSLSLAVTMDGMARSGGILTYFNPFYWFFWCYLKSYSLLSSGYSRSREFLADRMACSLYGSDVFMKGLEKVVIDSGLFEATIYYNIVNMLKQKKAFVNMYVAFRKWREETQTQKDRDKRVKQLLNEEPSVFDSHPTYKERREAVKALPKADKKEEASAMCLFESPEEMEKEMTDALTEAMDAARRRR
jgi:Zn-dependent protease with chaperone function